MKDYTREFTDIVYLALFGDDSASLFARFGVSDDESLRDCMGTEALTVLSKTEGAITTKFARFTNWTPDGMALACSQVAQMFGRPYRAACERAGVDVVTGERA